MIYHLICQVSVLTVGIYEKLPFAILQGVDLPVDVPLDLPGISSKVGICKKLPFAILQGVDLPVDLPLDARYQFSQ